MKSTFDRREMLKGATMIAGLGSVLSTGGRAHAAGIEEIKAQTGPKPYRRPQLIDRARTEAILTAAGLDAFVLRDPVNVYYASNYWSIMTTYGTPNPTYAVVPRQADRPVIAIMPAAETWTLSDNDADYASLIIYTGPAHDAGQPNGALKAIIPLKWPVSQDGQLTALEQAYIDNADRFGMAAEISPGHGLRKALQELGLTNGRLGIDDRRSAIDLATAGGIDASYMDADDLIRRVRLVKTPAEIALLRRAATADAEAAIAAAHQLRAGATLADFRRIFATEIAVRGGQYITCVAGTPGDLPHRKVVAGEPFMIDTVGHIERYCGDFGRTVVLGEPSAQVMRRVNRLKAAWDGVYERLKPGVRYSEISGMARDAVRGAGFEVEGLHAGPHSVGLQHSDGPRAVGPDADIVLEAGMTLTVDLPYIEYGWGTCHLEDLTLVTEHGGESLNPRSDPLIII